MRLTPKKIEEIILPIIGEKGLPLIKYLYGKENISEFDLAKKTKQDIKVIRKMLYFLYNHNLVGFNRKKDKEKGWYIYYWTLLPDNIRFMYFKRKKEQLEKLNQMLEEEHQELFFICPKKCVRLNFDQATDFEFHCPECGELVSQDDSEKKIISLKKEIAEIEEEIKKSKKKKPKTKAKKTKKLVRKKIEKPKKKSRKKTTKKIKKKAIKKSTKKPIKKKPVKKMIGKKIKKKTKKK